MTNKTPSSHFADHVSAWDGSHLFYEQQLALQGFNSVGGVDEAGRGPLAGPVVAACVVFSPDCRPQGYSDSKTLSSGRRKELYEQLISSNASFGVGIADAREIERLNILQASLLAMLRAVENCCRIKPDFLLVDGTFKVPQTVPQLTLVKGESKSISIAAASIIAKVTRDGLMAEYHDRYPQYGFIDNQGYPTQRHREAIAQYGPCPIHRTTFKGVREYCPDIEKTTIEQGRLW